MKEEIIAKGAEAQIILEKNILIKRRLKKSYRLPQLDEKIRKQRTAKESRILEKASKLIPIPKIINVNEETKEISMEFIDGKKLSEELNSLDYEKISNEIGKQIAILHNNDI